jgi:hypothetical protein
MTIAVGFYKAPAESDAVKAENEMKKEKNDLELTVDFALRARSNLEVCDYDGE